MNRHRNRWSLASRAERLGIGWKTLQFQDQRKAVYDKLGNKCSHCGNTDWRVLQIDHVNGEGKEERQSHGKTWIYNTILKDEEGRYQLLCANCHQIKHFELMGFTDGTSFYKKEVVS